MFIQTEITPNPDSLKFLPEKKVSLVGPMEFDKKTNTKNSLIVELLEIEGVESVFLGENFISEKKKKKKNWEELKHVIISYINDYYKDGKESVIDKKNNTTDSLESLQEVEKKIIKILETKVRPAVAKDGGDIKFKEFKNGVVKVQLQGSCSGCPSSTMTLKQGVQNLLTHYIPEVKQVEAI